MIYNRNYIIAATDRTAHSKLFARFRGKTAKEIYRFGKGIISTGSINGLLSHAIVSIGSEMSKGVEMLAIGSTAKGALGYISGVGFVR